MTALLPRNWRRFVAALCVGLLSFVLLEQVLHQPAGALGATLDVAMLEASGNPIDRSEGDVPQGGHVNHCCGAHAIGVPVDDVSTVGVEQTALRLARTSDVFVDARLGAGLDRPPRAMTIA